MEQHIPKTVQVSKFHHYKRCVNDDENEQLYLETELSGVKLWAGILLVRDEMWLPKDDASDNIVLWPIAFTSRCLTTAETHHSSIERDALDILHCLETFHHYCFTCEVSMVIDHKPLVVIFKDIAPLSYRLQKSCYIFISTTQGICTDQEPNCLYLIAYPCTTNMKIEQVDFLWNISVVELKTSFHPLLWTSSGPSDEDLMKSTVVDESLSSTQLQFCSRENHCATINPTEWETCMKIEVLGMNMKLMTWNYAQTSWKAWW